MSTQTRTAFDGLFGAPATVAEPPPVPVEVVPLSQPVPVIVIAQPMQLVPVRVPAAPCCLASRRALTGRRPVSGYPYWTRAEREQRQREIARHHAWCSAHIGPADDYCDG